MSTAGERPDVGLLDTSTFIQADRVEVTRLPSEIRLSTITLAELAVGPYLTDDQDEMTLRRQHLQDALLVERLSFDDACAQAFGAIAAELRRGGRKRRARAYDTLIAATAIANDLPLYSGNPADFEGIPGLDLRPVPAPAG